MSKPYHIIIADDDVDDQLIIKSALADIGKHVEITSVYNGMELISILSNKDSNPDLIILDINMPVMDGLDALIKIKKDKVLQEIPVYVLSTGRSPQRFEDSKVMGAVKCYSKPNSFTDYRSVIHEIISEAQ